MSKKIRIQLRIYLIAIATLLFFQSPLIASGEHEHETHNEEKSFNAGEMVLEHIQDSHDWHILNYKGHAVSIPLPVIIYVSGEGLKIFSSSRFEHGHASYEGFSLVKNKLVSEEGKSFIDFSITKNVFAMFMSIILLLLIFISVGNTYKRNPNKAPKGLQSWVEPLIIFIRDDIAKPSIGHKYERYLPFLLTIFFFIFINNIMGLIPLFPGGANVTGNISVTLVLALFTFVITLVSSNKNYWVHIFNTPGVPWWLKFPIPLMPIVEIMGVFTKPIVLMLRLFANITAGHIIVLTFFSLIFIFGNMSPIAGYGVSIVSIAFSIFMSFLELLVALLQAYVFTLLSALYFGMAIEEHH